MSSKLLKFKHTEKSKAKQLLDDVSQMTDTELVDFVCELIAVPSSSYKGKEMVMVTGDVNITTDNVSNNLVEGANNNYIAGGTTASGGFEAVTDGKMDINHVFDISGIRQVLVNLGNN